MTDQTPPSAQSAGTGDTDGPSNQPAATDRTCGNPACDRPLGAGGIWCCFACSPYYLPRNWAHSRDCSIRTMMRDGKDVP